VAETIEIGVDMSTADLAASTAQALELLQAIAAQFQQLAEAAQQSSGRIANTSRESATSLQREWQKAFAPITRSFENAISGMILGTTTLQQAMVRIGQSIVTTFVNNVVRRIVDQWLIGELAKTAATETGNAARTASDAGAAAASTATGAAGAKESVVQHAWSSAAAVYDDVAQIPYVGWILAPPAAAAAAAAVLAFGGNIPGLAVGAWNLPNDMIAQLHAGETVLPADFAAGFRAAAAGNGATGAGDTFAITIQAIDTQSGAQFLKDNARTIVSALQTQARNLNPGLRAP